jgi:flagellar basal body-associated protein FliL
MAEPDETKNKQKNQDSQQENPVQENQQDTDANDENNQKTDKKVSSLKKLLPWIIMAVVVAVCASAGFALGRLLANPAKTQDTENTQQDNKTQIEDLKPDNPEKGPEKTWYYDLDPVVANLDVPGVTRYVRATLTLELNSNIDQKKGTDLLEKKKPVLTNWLTIYLAGLTVEDIRGDKNLQRIQTQILDEFNENLFPDEKPQIKKILFKEFAIQ